MDTNVVDPLLKPDIAMGNMEHYSGYELVVALLLQFEHSNAIEFLTSEQLRDLIRYCEAEQIVRANNLKRT